MTAARDDTDFEPWPGEADPIRSAICDLMIVIMQNTPEESPARRRAMNEALAAHRHIQDAMRVGPTLN
jgi:hypothetical protein